MVNCGVEFALRGLTGSVVTMSTVIALAIIWDGEFFPDRLLGRNTRSIIASR